MRQNCTGSNVTEDCLVEGFLGLQWAAYNQTFLLVFFLYSIALLLLVFKETPIRMLTEKVPESCILIAIGVAIGAGVYFAKYESVLKVIDSPIIIDFLLPPIILDSAYQLYCKHLLYQLDAILMFAVVGTAFNVFAIGFSLYGAYGRNNGLGPLDCLLFAAIISAVDPVAVLAVFNQIGVTRSLYIIIFGESLFNDAVTVVFYETLDVLSGSAVVDKRSYLYAFVSLLLVSLGGWTVGFAYGVFSAIACKYTSMNSRILEPMIVFLLAYLAFLTAQIVHWSGFIALIACGLTQKRYAFPNLFEKSRITIMTGVETMAIISETAIFLILGIECYVDTGWNLAFILWTIFFCIIYRFVIIYALGLVMNLYRLQQLTFSHLFLMSYGGLRGAVSYALAAATKKNSGLFLTTTLAVILFTVFVQGATVKWIVLYLNFKERSAKKTFIALVLERVSFHSVAGMEAILGGAGTRIHYWLEVLEQCDKRFLRNYLCMGSKDLSGMTDLLYHKEIHRIYRIHNSRPPNTACNTSTVHCDLVPSLVSSLASPDPPPIRTSGRPESSIAAPDPSQARFSPSKSRRDKEKAVLAYRDRLGSDYSRSYNSHRRTRSRSALTAEERDKRKSIRKMMMYLQLQNLKDGSSD